MAEKESFRELATRIPPDVKCCHNCTHGRKFTDATTFKKKITCKALPRFPVPVSQPGGVAIHFLHPVLNPEDDCDLFERAQMVSEPVTE